MDATTVWAAARNVPTVEDREHLVTLDLHGWWQVNPAFVPASLTPDAAEQYARDLRDAARLALRLNEEERRRRGQPVNAAISDEVREIIAAREWTPCEAAQAFEMAMPTLAAKLETRQPWSFTDLSRIGEAVNPVSPGEVVMFLYQAATGQLIEPIEWAPKAA